MLEMPSEYEGREQSYIKHVVLAGYFEEWLYKIVLGGRGKRRPVWYVDCFAGPWEAREPNLQDTSFAKGLRTMNAVAEDLRQKHDTAFNPRAIFVENAPASYARLRQYVEAHSGEVQAVTLHGKFGDHVDEISRHLGSDPALLFVDPTGWKGADMRFIAPLASRPGRDVLINVMFEHINRFKDSNHEFVPQQMRDFFGLSDSDLPADLTEEQTMELYRKQLQKLCQVPLVADLVVPLATKNRTKFRLVVGGHHPAVLELFRRVEYKACGELAATVRTAARDRERDARTGALSLFGTPAPALDVGYQELHENGLKAIRDGMGVVLRSANNALPYREIWVRCLTKFHVRKQDVAQVVREMNEAGDVVVEGWASRQRVPKDDQLVRLP